MGINTVHPNNARQQLDNLFSQAKAAGKWHNTIAGTNSLEYWAEGVQDWFGANAETPLPDGRHNWVNTREDLQRYDAKLHDFIGQFFTSDAHFTSMHPAVNLYTKDDKKAYARINREKKLNIDVPQCRVEPVTTELIENALPRHQILQKTRR